MSETEKGATRKTRAITLADLEAIRASLGAWHRKSITDEKVVEVMNWWLEGATAAELAEIRGVQTSKGRLPGGGHVQIAVKEAIASLDGWSTLRQVAVQLVAMGHGEKVLQLRTAIAKLPAGVERRKLGGVYKYRMIPKAGTAAGDAT